MGLVFTLRAGRRHMCMQLLTQWMVSDLFAIHDTV